MSTHNTQNTVSSFQIPAPFQLAYPSFGSNPSFLLPYSVGPQTLPIQGTMISPGPPFIPSSFFLPKNRSTSQPPIVKPIWAKSTNLKNHQCILYRFPPGRIVSSETIKKLGGCSCIRCDRYPARLTGATLHGVPNPERELQQSSRDAWHGVSAPDLSPFETLALQQYRQISQIPVAKEKVEIIELDPPTTPPFEATLAPLDPFFESQPESPTTLQGGESQRPQSPEAILTPCYDFEPPMRMEMNPVVSAIVEKPKLIISFKKKTPTDGAIVSQTTTTTTTTTRALPEESSSEDLRDPLSESGVATNSPLLESPILLKIQSRDGLNFILQAMANSPFIVQKLVSQERELMEEEVDLNKPLKEEISDNSLTFLDLQRTVANYGIRMPQKAKKSAKHPKYHGVAKSSKRALPWETFIYTGMGKQKRKKYLGQYKTQKEAARVCNAAVAAIDAPEVTKLYNKISPDATSKEDDDGDTEEEEMQLY